MPDPIPEWTDAFDNLVSSRTNVLDLAGHYPYSPERWRLFVDGARVFPEYGSVAQYTHAGDYHRLQPAAGETVTFESAERPRYVVQYELAATWAFAVNQSLTAGDSIRVGLYDGTDGWYMEHLGSHGDAEADFVMERAGSEVYRRENIDIAADVLSNRRLKLQTGWYDITRQRWERSYAEDGIQQNDLLISTSADAERGSTTGNLPIHFSVTADSGTSGLELEAGSAAQVNLGATTELRRQKSFTTTVNLDTTGSWVPVFAIREAPDREIVNTQLSEFEILAYAGDNLDLLIQAHAPENVADGTGAQLTDSDFSTPAELSSANNVIQTTTAVDEAADSTGTVTEVTTNPGGYQIGYAAKRTAGGGTNRNVGTSRTDSKRSLYGRDIGVLWANGSATGDISFELRTEQDW